MIALRISFAYEPISPHANENMPNSFKVFHKLQIAHSALFRAADQRTRLEVGLSTTQLAVLFILARRDGQPISEISNTLAMGKSSLTGLIDRMCDKDLVRRSASPTDGRVTNIYLQELGRDALKRGKQQTARFNQALLEPFSVEEQGTIERFLTHLAEDADRIINGTEPTQGETEHD